MRKMQAEMKITALEQLKSVTDLLQSHMNQLAVDKEQQMDIRLCLMEAVQNGILYGGSAEGEPSRVHVSWDCNEEEIVFTVEDNGPGIPGGLRNRSWDVLDFEEHGRGILLMQTILDELVFNEKGNRLTGRMRWKQRGGHHSEERH